jgi:uncharacterized protein YneF (UPF0154 family)
MRRTVLLLGIGGVVGLLVGVVLGFFTYSATTS